jgi:hypothetical protein
MYVDTTMVISIVQPQHPIMACPRVPAADDGKVVVHEQLARNAAVVYHFVEVPGNNVVEACQ